MSKSKTAAPAVLAGAQPQGANPTPDESLAPAAAMIFGSPANSFPLRGGFVVEVGSCKARHVSLLIRLFNEILRSMNREQMIALVKMISEAQKKAVEAGEDASSVLIHAAEVDEMVGAAFGKAELLLSLFHSTAQLMPEIVSSLSNVTQAQYDDLDLDEAMIVVGAIFSMNYGFFSRNLPHVFRGFLAKAISGLQSK